ncbi:methyltransferase domain-containing protein [Candidatus Laterigemmans baculatus]|uniref:class I SAM-dependent methyltransferase n=1 Tax=Candidatus Laterigemmans baculatus TaxID=2770505 RepID=UPI0013DB748A|nr:class I SAM-dependent methyltransferase [Candidatus Laterigemmans baculatus]
MIEITLDHRRQPLPREVARFLTEADARIADFMRGRASGGGAAPGYRGFVPSDYVAIYHALRAISEQRLSCGDRFCEWGSGFGVIASLATQLGFEAYGIEIDRGLCEAAEALAEDHDLEVEFIHGSFVPPGAEALIDQAFHDEAGSLSLETSADDAYDELGLELADFDLVFVYPWPNDEALTLKLFEQYAADGALLLTYDESNQTRLYRR